MLTVTYDFIRTYSGSSRSRMRSRGRGSGLHALPLHPTHPIRLLFYA